MTIYFIYLLQLCISLNDIEYVREQLSKIPVALKFDAIISRMSEVEGDEQAVNARHTLTNMIEAANDSMLICFDEIAHSIGKQVRNDTFEGKTLASCMQLESDSRATRESSLSCS